MDETIEQVAEAAGTAVEKTNEVMKDLEILKQFVEKVKSLITVDNLIKVAFSIVLLVLMWIVYRLVLRGVKKVPEERMNAHKSMLLVKAIKYIFYVLVVMFVLSRFGVKLSAIWGAAGIAGVAIGFAAQTSVSNIISGIFVLTEKTIQVGDFIDVGGVQGVVDTVNLLSIRIHTLDNQMIRIPNSTVINSNLTNYNYNKLRRFCFKVYIGYEMDMEKALAALQKAPALCPSIVQDPEPCIWYDGFGDSGIKLIAAVWFDGANLIAAKNEMYIAIKKVFDEAGIEIPYNKIVVDSAKVSIESQSK